jgi:hypothetical protein
MIMVDTTDCLVAGCKTSGLFNSILTDGYIDSTVVKKLLTALEGSKGCIHNGDNTSAIDSAISSLKSATAKDKAGNMEGALEDIYEAYFAWRAVK